MKCPKCGQEAESRPHDNCYCNYCGYEGSVKLKLMEINEKTC